MTILNNIYRCKECGLHAIYEEKDAHVCLSVNDTRIENNKKWIFDGVIWYPLKLSKTVENQHPKLNTEKNHDKHPDTEQIFMRT